MGASPVGRVGALLGRLCSPGAYPARRRQNRWPGLLPCQRSGAPHVFASSSSPLLLPRATSSPCSPPEGWCCPHPKSWFQHQAPWHLRESIGDTLAARNDLAPISARSIPLFTSGRMLTLLSTSTEQPRMVKHALRCASSLPLQSTGTGLPSEPIPPSEKLSLCGALGACRGKTRKGRDAHPCRRCGWGSLPCAMHSESLPAEPQSPVPRWQTKKL